MILLTCRRCCCPRTIATSLLGAPTCCSTSDSGLSSARCLLRRQSGVQVMAFTDLWLTLPSRQFLKSHQVAHSTFSVTRTLTTISPIRPIARLYFPMAFFASREQLGARRSPRPDSPTAIWDATWELHTGLHHWTCA